MPVGNDTSGKYSCFIEWKTKIGRYTTGCDFPGFKNKYQNHNDLDHKDRLGAEGQNHSDTDTFQDNLSESLMQLFFSENGECYSKLPEPREPMGVRR